MKYTFNKTGQSIVLNISETTKLNSPAFGLQAGDTCPGKVGADSCKTCYAISGNYRFKHVKAVRTTNLEASRSTLFEDAMINFLRYHNFTGLFRWHDSGDIYDAVYAEKIYNICKRTQSTKHWIPTRSHTVVTDSNMQYWLKKLNSLPNVALRPSSGSMFGEHTPNLCGSTVIPSPEFYNKHNPKPASIFVCPSYKQGGMCNQCTACYQKSVKKTIAYVAHGQQVKKFYRTFTMTAI